ncbi:hypothetical protein J6590_032220, partial [Homalodisca vitripennis]
PQCVPLSPGDRAVRMVSVGLRGFAQQRQADNGRVTLSEPVHIYLIQAAITESSHQLQLPSARDCLYSHLQ